MRLLRSHIKLIVIIPLVSGVLSGCMVGPDFHSPATDKVSSYTESPVLKKTVSTPAAGQAGKAQYFAAGKDIPTEWWTLFHSKELNELILKGLANSPNLAAAKYALVQAKENLKAQIGSSLYPYVSLQVTGERQLFSDQSFGISGRNSIFNLYNVTAPVSYTLDIFGGLRRGIEVAGAQMDYQQYELEAAYLTLTSNIVTTAIAVASYRAQIQATHELVHLQQDQLKIVKQQFEVGGASRADILSQQSQLASTQATLPPLEQLLSQNLHALSVLVGELPSEDKLPHFDLTRLSLPSQLPISLPSLLARQRPDVRASEALLHVACAQVGVATANLYPQITLTGSYGVENETIANLFTKNNVVWSYSASLLQPIFKGGSLHALKRAAVAAFDEAAAQYRQTVLQAFQNVADTLRALEHDAQLLQAEKLAEVSAKNSLTLTREQYKLGGVNYLSLLTAEEQYQQAYIGRIKAQALRYSDTAGLFQSLGGGWWNREKSV